jgi:hypothetical protein
MLLILDALKVKPGSKVDEVNKIVNGQVHPTKKVSVGYDSNTLRNMVKTGHVTAEVIHVNRKGRPPYGYTLTVKGEKTRTQAPLRAKYEV